MAPSGRDAVAEEPARLSPLKNRALANCYIRAGRELARKGNLQKARQLFLLAAKLSPDLVEAYVYWAGCLVGGLPLRLAINSRHWVQQRGTPNNAGDEVDGNRKE